ncbi:MAG: nuclear transport factor 2 family protein, partial [Phyllobacteriaceae bacterium]|nr:nuclear transport factor 2 family protein [Phyllobacteriaceae bacterium]
MAGIEIGFAQAFVVFRRDSDGGHEIQRFADAIFGDQGGRTDAGFIEYDFPSDRLRIGTDATERWPIDEFRAYALPYFERESAWTYRPRERHITPLPGGDTAFFDELLDHDRYGECRGTGVLRRIDGAWRVSQYHLVFPIPNEVAEEITAFIRGGSGAPRWVFVVRHAEKEGS